MTTACRSCGASIVWARTAGGKAMPVDLEPVLDGNVTLQRTAAGVLATVDAQPSLLDDGAPRYVSHFVTCPQADEHRRPR